MKLARLRGKRVYIDTNPFIYFVEGHPDFSEVVKPLFDLIDQEMLVVCTSHFTLTELLIKPYRDGFDELIEDYQSLLIQSEKITLLGLTQATFVNAAQLGGSQGLRTPDALHIATALENQCDFFITNDQRIRSVKALEVVQLTDLLL
ncbi:MAG: type II toxin-antitoxin system VapC family toxin [Thiofilum sp.]|uniref:type II toxin-antitoxin system VapC family toxin n=1 Tax=Thiofilum sp. TaxID=2212733 RepID=UPI0025DA9DC7|nr:type II toxin-antitoxin system VapC family toxin [Thiofilum sp.]MBK8455568.1 type II toxin-antitoxin system VapC family toxin [Thiofilum sp.]